MDAFHLWQLSEYLGKVRAGRRNGSNRLNAIIFESPNHQGRRNVNGARLKIRSLDPLQSALHELARGPLG